MHTIALLGTNTALGPHSLKKVLQLNRDNQIALQQEQNATWLKDQALRTLTQTQLVNLGLLVRFLQKSDQVFLLDIQDPRGTLRVIDAMALLDKQDINTITPALQLALIEAQLTNRTSLISTQVKRNIAMSDQLLRESGLHVTSIDLSLEEIDNLKMV